MPKLTRLVSLSYLLFICTLALAAPPVKPKTKLPPATPTKLLEVVVHGNSRYTTEQILTAWGLKLGDTVEKPSLDTAIQRLGDVGVFTDVQYTYSFERTGTKVDLQVSESDKLIPVRFQNFVWFRDADLLDKLKQRVPLFQGLLPASGSISADVSDALQTLLIENKLPGHVSYIDSAALQGAVDAVDFTVTGVNFPIHDLNFPGASPADATALTAATQNLHGTDYSYSRIAANVRLTVLPVYQERGYLRALLVEAVPTVVSQSDQEIPVDVAVRIAPGNVYQLSAIHWAGNSVFPTSSLQQKIELQPGHPANAVRLQDNLREVQKLYGARGYMAASVKVDPAFDDAHTSVAYTLLVSEGDQYHMGEVEVTGLDAKTTRLARESWGLREGEPYDGSYFQTFMKQILETLDAARSLHVSLKESLNSAEKTVDVTLTFSPQ